MLNVKHQHRVNRHDDRDESEGADVRMHQQRVVVLLGVYEVFRAEHQGLIGNVVQPHVADCVYYHRYNQKGSH